MHFSHAFTAPAPAEQTWQLVSDVPAVLACLPGCSGVLDLGGDRYRLALAQRVGPFQVQFQAEAKVQREVAARRLQATGEGKDGRMGNSIQFDLALQLNAASDATHVAIEAEINVRGPVAQLGFGIMQHKARETFAEFTARVQAALGQGGGDHAPVSPS